MKLSELKKQGVASDGNERWVERTVSYQGIDEEGKEQTYHGAVMVRVTRWKDSKDIQKVGVESGDTVAAVIHHNVRLDGGKEVIPLEAVENLNNSLINALLTAVKEVNPVKDLGKF